jgi:hypothetical protein
MVIEYIGEVIRTELSELREKLYEARVSIDSSDIAELFPALLITSIVLCPIVSSFFLIYCV